MDGLQTSIALNSSNTLICIRNRGLKVKNVSLLPMPMRATNRLSLSTTALKTTSFSFGCLHMLRIYFSHSMLVASVHSKLHIRSRLSTWSKTRFTTSQKSSFYQHSSRLLRRHLHLAISRGPLEALASFHSILRLCYLRLVRL